MTGQRSRAAFRALVVALGVASLALAGIAARDSERFVGRTAPGFLAFPNGFVFAPTLAPDAGDARRAGLDVLDLVVAVGGAPIHDAGDLWAAAERAGPGVALPYGVRKPSGAIATVQIETRTFTASDRSRLQLLGLALGLALLAVGAAPAWLRPDAPGARVLFVFCWAIATQFCFLGLDHLLARRFSPWSQALGALAIGASLHLAGSFPKARWPFTAHRRAALAVVYGVPALLLIPYWILFFRKPASTYPFDLAAGQAYVASLLWFAANLSTTALRAPEAIDRQRARVVLLAPAAGLAASVGVGLVRGWTLREIAIGAFSLSSSALPLAIGYAIAKRNLFAFDAVARRALTLGGVGAAAALACLALVSGLQRLLGAETGWTSASVALVALAALVPAVQPLRRRLENLVGDVLFPAHRDAAAVLRAAGRALASLRAPDEMAQLLCDAATRSMQAPVLIALRSPDGVLHLAPAGAGAERAELAQLLLDGEATIDLDARRDAKRGHARDTELLERAGARLFVPLPRTESGGAGGLLLDARRDGRLYTPDDVALLETLAAHSAVALENAFAWEAVRAAQQRLAAENLWLRQAARREPAFDAIIGRSEPMQQLLASIEQVAPSDAPVLVLGETGTGKELVTRALHALSPRRDAPLVAVACAAIPETLVESELFGHEKGAFTDAASRKTGRIEAANGGTLFLDDVDALPLAVQAKLLRALELGEVQRLGASAPNLVDVRVVAASNRDLRGEVRAGRFREDLYYRLDVVPLHVPPLRARGDDVALLALHFAATEQAKLGGATRPIAATSLERLARHSWSGNVRELRNTIERAVVLSAGPEIEIGELGPATAAPDAVASDAPSGDATASLAERLRALKIALIEEALAAADGHQRHAAELLGLHRQSLARMMRELGMRDAA